MQHPNAWSRSGLTAGKNGKHLRMRNTNTCVTEQCRASDVYPGRSASPGHASKTCADSYVPLQHQKQGCIFHAAGGK